MWYWFELGSGEDFVSGGITTAGTFVKEAITGLHRKLVWGLFYNLIVKNELGFIRTMLILS